MTSWDSASARIARVAATSLATDCGAACLAMSLGYLGRHVLLDDLRNVMEIGRDGVNARAILDHVLQCSAVGTIDDVAAGLKAFRARTGVDEIIIASSMYDHTARKHSVALAMEAAGGSTAPSTCWRSRRSSTSGST